MHRNFCPTPFFIPSVAKFIRISTNLTRFLDTFPCNYTTMKICVLIEYIDPRL
ncbi:hypothetical protein C8R31_103187 [Nitrosospira sp. Nsp2]|nr:hypothetical protein C8R31_103187 [Nitrosospira sp. Nsp2]